MEHFASSHMNHSLSLVILSYLIATLSAYASIDLAKRVKFAQNKLKTIWLFAGGTVLGIGIWSMHFIAMLAYRFSESVYYDMFYVFLSILFAVGGCISGFYLVSRSTFTLFRFLLSGTIMGLGITLMHYVGMEAVKPVILSYDKPLFIISVFIAVAASLVALWLGFFSPYSKKKINWNLKMLFSFIMACAITGMHYTGMSATRIKYDASAAIKSSAMMLDTSLMAWIVTGGTFLIFIIFFFSLSYDRMANKHKLVQGTILDSAVDGIVVTEESGAIIHANPAFYELMNADGNDPRFQSLYHYHPNLRDMTAYNQEYQIELRNLIIEVKKHPISGESLQNSLWFFRNITEKILNEKHIEFLAYNDSLTRLPNRYKLEQELKARMGNQQKTACIFLDLDRLKLTNDTLGHKAGDALLQYAASQLSKVIGDTDILARVGGDEFIILLSGERANGAEEVADRCIEVMDIPFSINGSNIRATTSAGVSRFPDNASTADELLTFADLAMYESKRKGRNQVTIFNPELNQKIKRTLLIEKELTTAISNDELYLLYQPKICASAEKILGVEALLRWKNPVLGQVSPLEFISIAEEKDMICAITEWVLEEACRQWTKWENNEQIKIAVNISPIQFAKEDFLERLSGLIEKTNMNPRFLELEITESSSLAFESQTKEKLTQIKEMGIDISLDDFGTGYSSFKHLKEFPIEVLKIDKSFIDHLIGNKGQESIVRSMIQLGHNLNMKVLVEGVETKVQADWLKNEGCDIIQGFYYSRPTQPDYIQDFIRERELAPL
ncbi:EAL domain-containing protein [Bacillus sp. KH172YL63]|uniref:EAL domain-containing protein n=1 Tax=Bacillus sp. KH172YL63 TaxID=2709784 RepID=UPI0013E49EA9|nr:EAL domain-containing protein [Bacillus sp. KH172YL63]BCB06067.1 signaling protein YkoW [Bacillus sp. KH172YL63]